MLVLNIFISYPVDSQSNNEITGYTAEKPSITFPDGLTVRVRSLRSASLTFGNSESGLINDYTLFGIINDAITNSWKDNNSVSVYIQNGLTFNSRTSRSGELTNEKFDIPITIQIKKRAGNLIYTFRQECNQSSENVSSVQFDLISEDKFYTEMKRLTLEFSEDCPN
jgi:hypothetical protein